VAIPVLLFGLAVVILRIVLLGDSLLKRATPLVDAFEWIVRRQLFRLRRMLGAPVEPVAAAIDTRPWFRVTFEINDQIIEYFERSISLQVVRERALSRDIVLFSRGATVSIFDVAGNLLSMDGDVHAWVSERAALLASQEELLQNAPGPLLLGARLIPRARRADFLAEVLDDIECAREQHLPIFKRYLWIAIWALPSEIRSARRADESISTNEV
jgi:hypothetical protein